MPSKPPYTIIARKKQQQRTEHIPTSWRIVPTHHGPNVLSVPEQCGILSEQEILITSNYDAVDLLEALRRQIFSAEEVTIAFCKRAAIAQQLTNCLTEILFETAITRARNLDEKRRRNPTVPLGPLFGLPISLKDSFRVPGVDSTIGLACFAFDPDHHFSALPQLLYDLDAVFYCKTNVPQTMMTADSDNNLFGRTLNPNNLALTAGGSTGGEGSLIALRGSIMGFGTDIAGSIRIPSACNGIFGFKPSAGIVPFAGQRGPVPEGMTGIEPVAGPMATSARSVSFMMETLMRSSAWRYDAACAHVYWRFTEIAPKLKIGLVLDDGLSTPHPPVRRVLTEVAGTLRESGIEVVDVRLPEPLEALMTTIQMYALDENQYVQDLISSTGEPFVPSVERKDLPATPPMTFKRFFQLNASREMLQSTYLNFWEENALDAIVMPPAPHTALPFDEWLSISYTSLWNLLDYPACIIPVGHVQSLDVIDDRSNAQYGERDIETYELYTGPENFKNAPTAIQIVGMRQEDEKLTHVVRRIDEILRGCLAGKLEKL